MDQVLLKPITLSPDQPFSLPDTCALDDEKSALVIIDQTKLPGELVMLSLTKQKEIFDAIKALKVRGAPAIGVSAGIGIYLAAKEIAKTVSDRGTFEKAFHEAKEYLASSRPTAVNLFWALDRMEEVVKKTHTLSVSETVARLKQECEAIRDEDIASSRAIGENGLTELLRVTKKGKSDKLSLLTHCNAGQLATVRYGTALAPIHVGRELGYSFRVFTDETRPLLQGARLSACELVADGIETVVICDNMASQVMKSGMVDAVIVGADRIARNGDAANKIGTSSVAILAKYYGIPFYIAAPFSTVDPGTENGGAIVIEQRDPTEISDMWYEKRMAPDRALAFNPAFDVTDHTLITAFITERGVIKPDELSSYLSR